MVLSFCIGSFFTLNVYINSTFEAKIFFSRLRFIGFAFISPAGILFFSSILEQWKWLLKPWVKTLIFLPGIFTALLSIGIFSPELMVHSQIPFEFYGVSVIKFQTGPWFQVHYIWSNILTFSTLIMLTQAAYITPQRRKYIAILSAGIVTSCIIDIYGVTSNSPLRWLMISAGTFAISELAILYTAHKNGFFGILKIANKSSSELQEHLEFQNQLLTLLTHDLSGNMHQLTRLSNFLRGKLQDKDGEVLETLANFSQSSQDLLTNIMKWAKTQRGNQFHPQIETIEIHTLLSQCTQAVQAISHSKKIQIIIESSKTPFFIQGDSEMLASIIRNLLSNALQATDLGKKIKINVYEIKKNVHFEIQDEGHGMTPEEINLLWSKKGVKARSSGYGVGLILVRHLIELHRGRLEIQSILHKGTRVEFSIPSG